RTPARAGTTQELKHAARPKSEVAAEREMAGTPVELELSRRDESTAARPNAWIARRASHEGMTGPRNPPAHRTGLATADRWLIAGLMLTSSVLVAVLTSALTVRGMGRSGASLATPSVASRNDAVATVAAAPAAVVRDTMPIIRPSRGNDSVIFASAPRADSAPQHEDGGAVAPLLTSAPRLSPMPARVARVAPAKTEKHEPPRAERRTISVAQRVRTAPPEHSAPPEYSAPITQTMASPAATLSSSVTSAAATVPVTTPPPPVVQPPVPASAPPTVAAAPPAAAPASAPAANNAQFLEELRAIHAEIDARKKHMDSLTASLDSLKRIKP
ncbi:MAG: hypothetical protein M3Y05_17480, partial [Gemmatimonadota bacterium]|nr:hypothetical protein [Gemmatimonadota bacterium]